MRVIILEDRKASEKLALSEDSSLVSKRTFLVSSIPGWSTGHGCSHERNDEVAIRSTAPGIQLLSGHQSGATMGTESMVLKTAITSKAVKRLIGEHPFVQQYIGKMIMIRALVCNSNPMMLVAPFSQRRILPATWTPTSLPPTESNQKEGSGDENNLSPLQIGLQSGAEKKHGHDDPAGRNAEVYPYPPGQTILHPLTAPPGRPDHIVAVRPQSAINPEAASQINPTNQLVGAGSPAHQFRNSKLARAEAEEEQALATDAGPVP